MVDEGLGALGVNLLVSFGGVFLVLEGLEDGVEEALPGFDLFMGDSHGVGGGAAKGLLGALALLVLVHFCLPGVEAVLAAVEQHLQLQ